MLKITTIETDSQTTLVLEGKLVEPWVAELEKIWSDVQNDVPPGSVVVDLMDVTLIGERGQELLRQMLMAGTTFNCCRGVHTKHVIKKIVNGFAKLRGSREGNR